MKGRRRGWTVMLRRAVQIFFLLAFVGLILAARFQPEKDPSPLLKAFFTLDPLVHLATWLTTHEFLAGALAAVGVLAVTMVLGRVFCGWFCPLGTVHDAAGWLFDRFSRRGILPRYLKWMPFFRSRRKRQDAASTRRQPEAWSPWQRTKYLLLAGMLVMAIFGSAWVCLFDPLVLFYRSTTAGVLPGAQWAVESGSKFVYDHNQTWILRPVSAMSEPAYQFLREQVFVVPHQAFLGGGLILAIFVGLVLLNAYRRRFWCRYVCPLGALLGIFARRPWLRRVVDDGSCNRCGLCACGCHGAAGDCPDFRGNENGTVPFTDNWRASECLVCLNCSSACPRGSIAFAFISPLRKEPKIAGIDLSRRAVLASAAGGLTALAIFKINPQSRGTRFNPGLIRPPGAREEKEFLARCTACGLCMKICPTGGLQPAWTEAGLEGLWTPRLAPEIGYCEYNCNLCTQVCPTQAIQPLALEEKHQVRIGLAAFDVTRCIPYAYGRDCTVCHECCPVPEKAIFTVETEVRDRDGAVHVVNQPKIDPTLCIGCGNCVNVCPLKDRPGVYVTSANESRHSDNQPILGGGESPY